MAVHTPVAAAALRRFLQDYDIGALAQFHGIAEGVENSNFLLETEQNRFILTLFEKRIEAADLPFYLQLMEHLRKRGIICPQPVLRSKGGALGELAGRPAAIFSFLPGKAEMCPSVSHCETLGAALAALHLAGRDFPLRQRNSLGQADWLPLWQKCRLRAADYAGAAKGAALQAEIDAELEFLARNRPQDLPQGIIHADVFPDNVFWQDGQFAGLIDFYFACTDNLAYDIAICLNAWCFEADGGYNAAKGAALLAGYQRIRPLIAAEKQALPVLARGAALRFFLTRFYDWFHTPSSSQVVKKDPQEYLQKLRFFRAAAGRALI